MNALPVACPRCQAALPGSLFNLPDYTGCPACGVRIQIEVFPALFRRVAPGSSGEPILVEGESSCFYHPQKKAAVVCAACGRFLCGLCDCDVGGQHLCPVCLEAGKTKGKIQSLENHRTLYDTTALRLSLVPLLLTTPVALYLAARYWNTPTSIIPRSKARFILAILFSLLQIAWGILLVYYLMYVA